MPGRLIYDNKVNGATMSATTEATNYDADNVKTQALGERWRSTAVTDPTYLTADLLAAYGVRFAALWGINLTSSATLTLEGDDEATFTAPPVSQAMTVHDGLPALGFPHSFAFVWLSALQTYRYWRYKIQDSGNPAGYFEVARAIIGDYIEYPIADGQYSAGWVDESEQARSRGGAMYVYPRPRYRMITAQTPPTVEATKDAIVTAIRNNGKEKDLIFSAFAGDGDDQERDNTVLGLFTDFAQQSYQAAGSGVLSVSAIQIAENI